MAPEEALYNKNRRTRKIEIQKEMRKVELQQNKIFNSGKRIVEDGTITEYTFH